MLDLVLFVALPGAAAALFVAGTVRRVRSDRFSLSALSSQFLESRALPWGTLPWHAALLVLLVGHLVPLLAPGAWQELVRRPAALAAVEAVGLAAGLAAAAGLAVLLVRRVTVSRLQAVTTPLDLLLLVLLLLQVGLGIDTALRHRWGAQWAVGTLVPFLRGALLLRPDLDRVAGLPPVVKLHWAGAWLLLAVLPFSRLAHVVSVPLGYLVRPPLRVVWSDPRRRDLPGVREARERRRDVVTGLAAVGGAGFLLSIGVLDKLARYFSGTAATEEEETDLLRKRLARLEEAARQREAEIERLHRDSLPVARLDELTRGRGVPFTDYLMRPGLAFRGEDGWPLLVSAKCTHLGCTLSGDLDPQGRLLCPCHVSYFDPATGRPFPGSPARDPLPHLGWIVLDEAGREVASRGPRGTLQSAGGPPSGPGYTVHIARRFRAEEA